jgi:hypothetical protein
MTTRPRCVDVNDAHDGCPCKTAPNREAAMVTIRRDATGKPTIWCDPCIAPLVAALNDAGYPTVASCCGHGTLASTIALTDGRWLTLSETQPADEILWALRPMEETS